MKKLIRRTVLTAILFLCGKKLRTMIIDHMAMNIFRRHRGDLELVSWVGGSPCSEGYEAIIFQWESTRTSNEDPAKAILHAYKTWHGLRGEKAAKDATSHLERVVEEWNKRAKDGTLPPVV